MSQPTQEVPALPSDGESPSAPFPKRYIPWIPLIAFAHVLLTVVIFSAVIAPYAGTAEIAPISGNALTISQAAK